jgi:SAM-dependent methyltransferase
MTVDSAGTRAGIPERFVPKDMRGKLIEAEHLGRYRWAAEVAAGKRVLDAGCGVAYGTAILAEAGAAEVVGVDIAEAVLESVRGEMPEAVELRVGDLTALDLEDDQFDVVVCFEVIEHFADPQVVLDELARVLTPGGTLLVSSPNRGVYPPGNPHHHHEFTPDELSESLRARFAEVQLLRQQTFLTAAVLSTPLFKSAPAEPLADLPLYKLVGLEPGEEVFTLAVAGDGTLPAMPSLAVMSGQLGIHEWVSALEAQEEALQQHRRYIQELETKVLEREQLEERLLNAEQRLTRLPELERRLGELTPVKRELELTQAALQSTTNSVSWRITKPLRDVKGRLRSLLSRH